MEEGQVHGQAHGGGKTFFPNYIILNNLLSLRSTCTQGGDKSSLEIALTFLMSNEKKSTRFPRPKFCQRKNICRKVILDCSSVELG